ncbi:GGDEF domain-containing protein [Undibacterium sp. SXout7W]
MISGLQTDVISVLHSKQAENFCHSGSAFSDHVPPYSHSRNGTGSHLHNLTNWAHDLPSVRYLPEKRVTPNTQIRHQSNTVWLRETKEKTDDYRDELTGLPNRKLLQECFEKKIAYGTRSNKQAGFLLINLDRFKEVNAVLGHAVGDKLLCKVVNRLTHCIGVFDSVCRYEGDKFVVIVSHAHDKNALNMLSNKIRLCLEAPYLISGKGLIIGISIGSAIFPAEGDAFQTIFEQAERDMRKIKTQ